MDRPFRGKVGHLQKVNVTGVSDSRTEAKTSPGWIRPALSGSQAHSRKQKGDRNRLQKYLCHLQNEEALSGSCQWGTSC